MSDPIVEEARKHRMEHTRKLHGDLAPLPLKTYGREGDAPAEPPFPGSCSLCSGTGIYGRQADTL
jgi:hypothetical protein